MGEKFLLILFAIWMFLIFGAMICFGYYLFRYLTNQKVNPKEGLGKIAYTFLARLPFWLKFVWWFSFFSTIAVSLINTILKHPR